jgi:hypothetical protein
MTRAQERGPLTVAWVTGNDSYSKSLEFRDGMAARRPEGQSSSP